MILNISAFFQGMSKSPIEQSFKGEFLQQSRREVSKSYCGIQDIRFLFIIKKRKERKKKEKKKERRKKEKAQKKKKKESKRG